MSRVTAALLLTGVSLVAFAAQQEANTPVVATAEQQSRARSIVARYLAMEIPERGGGARGQVSQITQVNQARHDVLKELQEVRPAAVAAIKEGLAQARQARQRGELLGTLEDFPGKETAAVLSAALDDADDATRLSAISTLRALTRRVNVLGPERRLMGEAFAPRDDGLSTLLVKAANDKVELNRRIACYALADSRDAVAVAALRQLALKDPSPGVRLYAACFLTEYQDATGLEEMKKALREINAKGIDGMTSGDNAVMVLTSMARITGKSFGPVPMEPGLYSDLKKAQEAREQIRALTVAWLQWWDWTP